MKTSAISYRVADFLKGYPPFCYLDETARERIAASGRVRYHERDEILYQQGKPREGLLRVIQQGLVRLANGPDGDAETLDLRGEGEMLGLGSYLGRAAYSATAITLEDTILYALDAEIFNEEVAKSRAASQFLAAYYSVVDPALAPRSETAGVINWSQPLESTLTDALKLLLTCPSDCEIQVAARQMAGTNNSSILVVDPEGRPLGVITDADLRDQVATGAVAVSAPVSTLLKRPPAIAMPSSSVGDVMLTFMANGTRHLCLTEDGAPDSRAIGAISERELMVFQGNNPLAILEAIRKAATIPTLIPLRARIDDLVLAGLRSPADTDWYCQVSAEAHRALFRRILELTAERLGSFDTGATLRQFALIGSAGRREMLTQTDLSAMLILDESATDSDRIVALRSEVQAGLSRLGFAARPYFCSEEDWCGTLGDWVSRFERWIAEPVESDIYTRLAFFDFELLDESSPAGSRLREAIRGFLAKHPVFIRLLANDCFSNLPPVSIIRGFAIDTEGTWKETLDIKHQALQPVADVARVLSLDAGDLSTRSTLARLAAAERLLPEAAEIFVGAARAFRAALFHRARQGLRSGTDGNTLRPSDLPRADRTLLKTGFNEIARLLDFVGEKYRVGS
jgi:CBS domain-containing protein